MSQTFGRTWILLGAALCLVAIPACERRPQTDGTARRTIEQLNPLVAVA